MSHHLRVFDYVNRPYASVRDALLAHPLAVFQRATSAAATRSDELSSALRASIGPIDVAADIDIRVLSTETAESPGGGEATRITLEWQAAKNPGLFPVMRAVLSVYALTSTETQLDLEGDYQPPLGALGRALAAVVGHRIAQASVHHFISQVANHLRVTP